MARKPRKKRKLQVRIAAKIRKVKKDSPSLTLKQVLGKAFGILRGQGVAVPRKRRKRRKA